MMPQTLPLHAPAAAVMPPRLRDAGGERCPQMRENAPLMPHLGVRFFQQNQRSGGIGGIKGIISRGALCARASRVCVCLFLYEKKGKKKHAPYAPRWVS